MALRTLVHLPVTSPFPPPAKSGHLDSSVRLKPPSAGHYSVSLLQHRRPLIEKRRRHPSFLKAGDESQSNSEAASESASTTAAEAEPAASQPVELSELGKEIKAAMQKRKDEEEEKDGGFFSGVGAEVKEIEWPPFAKVLGTTGVVLGVIAGSSVVLLTVNAVLAELSDKLFAGKGVQDFFG